MKKLLFLAFLLASTCSFAQSCFPGRFSETPLFDSSDVKKDSNIVYATSKNYFTNVMQQLIMDVYYPDPAVDTMQQRPMILLIHGGGFLAGSRHEMDYQCMEYARRGFVAATIEYRVGWNCAATDMISICLLCQGQNYNLYTATYCAAQDARAALRYINANTSTWNADPNRLFVGGESAGSITSYHAAFWDQQEANTYCSWAVGQVGTLDTAGNALPNTWSVKALVDNCGAITKDSALLNNGNIPVVSFHDDGDCVVPYAYGQVIACLCTPFYWAAGSSATHTFLSNNGVCTELNTVTSSINHCSYPSIMVVKRASCFMKRVMCNSCVSSTNTNIWSVDSCNSVMAGVSEFNMRRFSIAAYPNPSNNECDIRFSEPSHNSSVLEVFNSIGELVFEQAFPPLTTGVRLNTAGLADGIYFVNASGANIRLAVCH